MKSKLLKILQDAEGFVSGQSLSDQMNVSRTAVWKAIKGLEEDGYIIEAVRNKGYCLVKEPDIMTRESCLACLNTKYMGRELTVYQETDSTNTRLKQMAESGAKDGSVVAADSQKSGKGRLGRVWNTPAGSAIAFSLLLRPQLRPDQASMITLVSALAVSEALDEVSGLRTSIKWPNDIVSSRKKLSGILTEMSADMDRINYVIVGIGINVQMQEFPKELQDTATSLRLETGRVIKRSMVLAKVLEKFEIYYEQFCQQGSLGFMKKAYEERLANMNEAVCVISPAGDWKGICRGIRDNGALLVEKEDGSITEVISGEVSVRGIYGYV